MTEEEKEKQDPEFYMYKNRNGSGIIEFQMIASVECGEYMGLENTIYTMSLTSRFGSQIILEFHDEEIRDVEFKNLIDLMDEFGYIFHNKTV